MKEIKIVRFWCHAILRSSFSIDIETMFCGVEVFLIMMHTVIIV